MDQEEFFDRASKPDFSDAMNFQLQSDDPNPERSFSVDGINEIAQQIQTFILARVYGTWDGTGQPPKTLFATVSLKIGEPPFTESTLDIGLPWSNFVDGAEGVDSVDGRLRHDAREHD